MLLLRVLLLRVLIVVFQRRDNLNKKFFERIVRVFVKSVVVKSVYFCC